MKQIWPAVGTLVLITALTAGLSGCGEGDILSQYGAEDLWFIAYTDIDTVCEDRALTEAGADFMRAQAEGLLLSYAVDSAIELTPDELGDCDHLILTNRRWVERFGSTERLRPVEFDSLPAGMRDFLESQMPLLTADGALLPPGAALYGYEGGGLPALPVNVTLGAAEAIEAERPLLLLLEDPAADLRPESCLLPLTSSGNILLEDRDTLAGDFAGSALSDYGALQKLGEK